VLAPSMSFSVVGKLVAPFSAILVHKRSLDAGAHAVLNAEGLHEALCLCFHTEGDDQGCEGALERLGGKLSFAMKGEDVARLDMGLHLDQVGRAIGGVEVELDLRSPDAEDDPLGVDEHETVGGGKGLAGELLNDFPNHMLQTSPHAEPEGRQVQLQLSAAPLGLLAGLAHLADDGLKAAVYSLKAAVYSLKAAVYSLKAAVHGLKAAVSVF